MEIALKNISFRLLPVLTLIIPYRSISCEVIHSAGVQNFRSISREKLVPKRARLTRLGDVSCITVSVYQIEADVVLSNLIMNTSNFVTVISEFIRHHSPLPL